MKTFLALLVGKLAIIGCKMLAFTKKGSGSVTPGSWANKIDEHLLENIKYPRIIIAVTGSSGKGSTTAMINHILTVNNYKTVYNKSGSNLKAGATTAIIEKTGLFSKKIKADVLLLECDESYIARIFPKVKPTHLVVTNITRDQPARNGTPYIIYNKIKEQIDPSTTLVLNVDDPIVNRLKYETNCNVITYGIDKYETDTKKPISNTVDQAYCPICGKKLKYDFYHYGHIGSYSCPKGDFTRDPVNYVAKDINLDKKYMTINNHIAKLDKNAFFACYYTLAAYAICNSIGLSNQDIQYAINDKSKESKRGHIYFMGRRMIELAESKNENCLSYLQTINHILDTKGTKTIVMGFDNVSRRYKFNDLSWLYDVDFEKLNDPDIDKIFCIGRFKYDVYARLIHAGIDKKKLIIQEDMKTIIKDIKVLSKGSVFTMLCFDKTEEFKKLLEKSL